MAFLGIRVPHETARLFHGIDVPGDKADSALFHITLLYLGKDISIKEISKAMMATFEVSRETSPFLVKTGCVNCFEPPKEGMPYPVIAPVNSQKLHELRENLEKSFNKVKANYDTTYKEYKPHITLSFHNEAIKREKIEPIEWVVQELVLWSGKDGDEKLFITFPLSNKHED